MYIKFYKTKYRFQNFENLAPYLYLGPPLISIDKVL